MKGATRLRLGRIAKVSAIVLLIMAGGAVLWLRSMVMSGLPKTNGVIILPGLSNQVEVLRDRKGVPHIFALNEDDLFMAVGYVQAQDRLWQMELIRRTAEGKLAELFGDRPMNTGVDSVTLLDQDKAQRVLGFHESAKRDVSGLDPVLKNIVESFCLGVNAYIEQNRSRLPFEFRLLRTRPEPWTPADVLAVGRFISFGLSHNYTAELVRQLVDERVGRVRAEEIFPRHEDPGPYIIPSTRGEPIELLPLASGAKPVPPAQNGELISRLLDLDLAMRYDNPVALAFGGSNSWVVSGTWTASGYPILSNDPHLPHMLPSLFYEMHMVCPGIDAIGVAFPGIPQIVLGHNRNVAWSATTTNADTQDLFVEQVDPANSDRYMHNEIWKKFDRRIEIIYVKGGSHIELPVDSSVHGPILNSIYPELGESSPPVALAWPGHHGERDGIIYYRAMKAENLDQCLEGAALNEVPIQNWIFADTGGRIGYYPAGLYPKRKPGHWGLRPVPGTGEYDWQGWIDTEDIPMLVDPPQGYIISANNQVMDYIEEPFLITNENSPYYRAARIERLLTASNQWKQCFANLNFSPRLWDKCAENYEVFSKLWLWPWRKDPAKGLDLGYMLAMQVDTFSMQGQRLAPHFADAARESGNLAPYAQILDQWDYRTDPQSVGATIFYKAYQKSLFNVLGDELGDELLRKLIKVNTPLVAFDNILDSVDSKLFDNVNTPGIEDRNAILALSLQEAVEELAQLLGPDPSEWSWGRIHTITFKHPFGGTWPFSMFMNIGPLPSPGGNEVVFEASFNIDGKTFPVHSGAVLRHVVDMSDPAHKAGMVIDTGQSGHFKSYRYRDQAYDMLRGRTVPMLMDREDIEKNYSGLLRLQPQAE